MSRDFITGQNDLTDFDLEIILNKLSEVYSNLNPINHDDLIEDDSIEEKVTLIREKLDIGTKLVGNPSLIRISKCSVDISSDLDTEEEKGH